MTKKHAAKIYKDTNDKAVREALCLRYPDLRKYIHREYVRKMNDILRRAEIDSDTPTFEDFKTKIEQATKNAEDAYYKGNQKMVEHFLKKARQLINLSLRFTKLYGF